MRQSARVVLTCLGSLGDLYPYLALGQELARRGHRPLIATVPSHRERVEAAGLPFHPLRGLVADEPRPELVRRVFNGRQGMEYLLRELVLPALRTAYDDTCAAAQGADLLLAHPLTWTTRLVAETRDLPWLSTQLAPSGILSATDPPVLPGLAWLHRLHPPPAAWRAMWRLADRATRRWFRPYDALREQLGVADAGNPMFAGGHAPAGDLALFSPLFGPPQRDWPAQTEATGFPFFRQPALGSEPELRAWLDRGSPPIVFTLGSAAVMDAGTFFRESAAAARRLGRRALLLGATPPGTATSPGAAELEDLAGPDRAGRGAPVNATDDVFICRYAPYAEVFPRAAAVVHQGGIGTTAEALRSGHPMLVVPFGADQPDNGARAERLGVARVLSRGRYRRLHVASVLRSLLHSPAYGQRALEVAAAIRAEDGTGAACDRIEAVLASRRLIPR